jgi:hypothetical protein
MELSSKNFWRCAKKIPKEVPGHSRPSSKFHSKNSDKKNSRSSKNFKKKFLGKFGGNSENNFYEKNITRVGELRNAFVEMFVKFHAKISSENFGKNFNVKQKKISLKKISRSGVLRKTFSSEKNSTKCGKNSIQNSSRKFLRRATSQKRSGGKLEVTFLTKLQTSKDHESG